MTKLSICIPTYNRSRYLAELLDSIVNQCHKDVEVVISDDASTDDTFAVADLYKNKISRFTFVRQPVNIGLDRNFIAVTTAAMGDYVWLMGDDDTLEPGGIARVLDAIHRWPSVVGLTLGVIDYDVELRHPTGVRGTPETQLITGASSVFSTIPELLGFMSAMVLDRQRWEQASQDPSVVAMNNLYTQVYIAGRAIGKFGTWGVVQEPCVRFRTSNDQFKNKLGWLNRLKIDARAYDEIADLLFGDDPKAHLAMRRRVFNTHILARIINAKTEEMRLRGSLSAARYLIKRYSGMPKLWLRGLPILIAPKQAVRTARVAYQALSRSSGAARARKLD